MKQLFLEFFVFLFIINFSSCTFSLKKTEELKTVSVSKDVVNLNMVGHWLNEGKREKLMHEFVNEFEFENQEIKVSMKFPEEIYKYDKDEPVFIAEQVSKPKADYDIIRIKSHYPEVAVILKDENWGSKYLVDFSEVPGFLSSQSDILDIQTIKDRSGNICMSPYMEGNYEVIYANLDVAKKLGIKIKQYGMTFEDFTSYLKAIDDYNKTNKTSLMAIFENEDNGWVTTETIFMRLYFSLLDNYNEISNIRISEKKMKALEKTYLAYESLSKYHPLRSNKYRAGIDWERDNDYPLKDSCLFFVNGSYMYNIWDGKNHSALSKMLPCELPVFKATDTYMGDFTSNWCIPKNAPHLQAAIKLMMYWCKPSMAEKWVRYTKCPTGIKGNLTEISFGTDAYEDFQFTINKKYGKNLRSAGDYKYLSGNDFIPLNSLKVLSGEITGIEALNILKTNQKKYNVKIQPNP